MILQLILFFKKKDSDDDCLRTLALTLRQIKLLLAAHNKRMKKRKLQNNLHLNV